MAAVVLAFKFDMPVLINGSVLALTLLVGAIILALVRRWWRREEPTRDDAGDQLAHYRSLYEKGELSEQEYKRLRTVLGGQLRQAFDLPARPAREAPPPTEPDPEPPAEGIRPA